jgi:hypothetical protein
MRNSASTNDALSSPTLESLVANAKKLLATNPSDTTSTAIVEAARSEGASLLQLLFPAAYNALAALHSLNETAAQDGGFDWDTLQPAIDAVSAPLGLTPPEESDDNSPEDCQDEP